MQEEFVQIGTGILVSFNKETSEHDVTASSHDDPSIIVIFGWLGAKLLHLHKYTKVYRERYPHAIIFLVRSYHSFLWSTEKANQARLLPLVVCLEKLGCITFRNERPPLLRDQALPILIQPLPSRPRILVHSFSNGGSIQVVTLGKLLSKLGCIPARHISALIIDSSPGGNFATTRRAFSGFIKNPLLRALAAIFISIFYFSLYIRGKLFGTRSPIQMISDALTKANVLPWTDERTPRLYVFSKKDELVPWDQVEATVKMSEKVGLDTRVEMFEDSPHVAHARTDPARYWGAARKTWEDACSINMKN